MVNLQTSGLTRVTYLTISWLNVRLVGCLALFPSLVSVPFFADDQRSLKVLSSQARIWKPSNALSSHSRQPCSLRNDSTFDRVSSGSIFSRDKNTLGCVNGEETVPKKTNVGIAVTPVCSPQRSDLNGCCGSFHSSRVLSAIHRKREASERNPVAKISLMTGRALTQSGHHGAVKKNEHWHITWQCFPMMT